MTAASFLVITGVAGGAMIEVTESNDELANDGDCSLREAMISANENASQDDCKKGDGGSKTDVIALGSGNYNLDITGSDEDANLTGDLDYTGGGKLTIRGADASTTVNALLADDRVLHASENAKTLRLQRIEVRDGAADAGGNLLITEGALELDRAGILSGEADVGGGVYFSGDGGFDVIRSSFLSNTASSGGGLGLQTDGPVSISKTSFENNTAEGGASRGGAIWDPGGPVKIADSVFEDNTTSSGSGGSASGAAIFGNDVKVTRTLFQDNDAEELAENVGADGGAVRLFGNSAVTNSTFYGNESADDGGAFAGEGKLAHVTFLQNSAEGQGDHIESFGDGVVIRNSILPGASIAVDICAGNAVTSKGFNVFTYDDASCGTLDSDVTDGGNAGLTPGGLADNGGFSFTIGLEPDSVAKDLVPKRECKPAKSVDQRGFKRPKGPRCDAGAFERGAQPDPRRK